MELSMKELAMCEKALVAAEKSAQRLAAKEGQPQGVADEYRKFAVEVTDVIKRVQAEMVKIHEAGKREGRSVPKAA